MSTEVEGPKSSQGIPPAEFIEDVDAYMSKKADKETPDEVVQVCVRANESRLFKLYSLTS